MNNIDKHKKMVDLYKNEPRVIGFISKFFKVRNGVRCIAFQDKKRNIYNRYRYFDNKTLRYVNNDNCFIELSTNQAAGFFYEYMFNSIVNDNNIKHWRYDEELEKTIIFHNDRIIGSSIMLEIDMPKIGDNKVDMFNENVYDDTMKLKQYIEKNLDESETRYNCMYSGNGIYIIIESIYLDKEKITFQDLRNIRKNVIVDNQLFNDVDKPMIDDFDHGWANYFKIPFTYHEHRDRITIPLSRGYINKEWLNKATDMNSDYCFTQHNISDIIENCRWKDIW